MESNTSVVDYKLIPFLKKWDLINVILGILDILAITVAFQISYSHNYSSDGGLFFSDKKILLLYLGLLPFWVIILHLIKIAEIPRTKRYRILFFEYFQSAVAVSLILMIAYFIFKMGWISRLFLLELTFLGFVILFFVRVIEFKVFKSYRARGYNNVNIILVADDSSLPFIETLQIKKEWGYNILAIFTSSELVRNKYHNTLILHPEEYMEVLYDLMEVDIIDEILYIKDKVMSAEVRKIIRSCEELGVTFRLKIAENKIKITSALETNIGRQKFLNFINIPYNSYALALKKVMDINISFLVIILSSPLLAGIAVFIKMTSEGPIIYRQKRVGLRGRNFNLYKFRTMVANAEMLRKELETENESDGPVFKIKDDPRITSIGKFLRKTGLDELPQLFNVLKGEMSLIGPRPPLQSETIRYKRWQLRRLSVKPGLSCFWQIKPDRNQIKFEDWMEMDLSYIDNWSIRLDLVILLKTIKTVFLRSGS